MKKPKRVLDVTSIWLRVSTRDWLAALGEGVQGKREEPEHRHVGDATFRAGVGGDGAAHREPEKCGATKARKTAFPERNGWKQYGMF